MKNLKRKKARLKNLSFRLKFLIKDIDHLKNQCDEGKKEIESGNICKHSHKKIEFFEEAEKNISLYSKEIESLEKDIKEIEDAECKKRCDIYEDYMKKREIFL